jgi:hypothetical protein
MLKFNYQIKKKAKDKGDYRITKHGQVAEFSLREINRNIEQIRKQTKEIEANAKLQESLAENIRRANPDLMAYIKKLSPKKRFSLTMLAIQENKAKQFKDQERQTKSILRTLLKEDKEVRRQLRI